MIEVVPYLIVIACLALVLAFFTWLKRVVRRRGLAGSAITGALTAYEEAMRITSHEAHQEIRAQAERQAPTASPDDPLWTPRGAMSGATGQGRSARRRTTRAMQRRLLR